MCRYGLLYLIFDRLLGGLLLLGRNSSAKNAELLILRHDTVVIIDPTAPPSWLSYGAPSARML
jgi:hypothetical protein